MQVKINVERTENTDNVHNSIQYYKTKREEIKILGRAFDILGIGI